MKAPRSWPLRIASLASLGICGGITAMLVIHRSEQPIIGPFSISAAIALLLASSATVLSIVMLLLPPAWAEHCIAWVAAGIAAFRAVDLTGSRRHWFALVLLAFSTYTFVGVRWVLANDQPLADQADYLRQAASLRASGGVADLWRQLWAGQYERDRWDAGNRHPLYVAILATWPDFRFGKLVSLALGLISLMVISRPRHGKWLQPGIATVLLATNNVFLQSASLVACEMLLITFSLLAWMTLASVERQVAVSPVADMSRASAIRSSMVTGLWLGLAYLTKASGFFLIVGVWLWSLAVPTLRRWSWIVLVAFGVVASPLLIRNARVFGNPLYSFNTRFLFADSFEEGLRDPYHGARSAAAAYFADHSGTDIVRRAISGFGWETFILLRSLGPGVHEPTRPIVGSLLLLLAAIGTTVTDRRLTVLAGVWCVMFWLFFAWYVPIAAGDRFLAPIVPVILWFASRGIVATVGSRVEARFASRRMIWLAAVWCLVIVVINCAPVPVQTP